MTFLLILSKPRKYSEREINDLAEKKIRDRIEKVVVASMKSLSL